MQRSFTENRDSLQTNRDIFGMLFLKFTLSGYDVNRFYDLFTIIVPVSIPGYYITSVSKFLGTTPYVRAKLEYYCNCQWPDQYDVAETWNNMIKNVLIFYENNCYLPTIMGTRIIVVIVVITIDIIF